MSKVDDAIEFFNESNEAEANNRALALTDLKFRYGDQWPDYAMQARGQDRPKLTINETDTYLTRVCNMQRQQRPRIKVQPVDDVADPKIAKVIEGCMRHIEVMSNADVAYATAFDHAATMGWGYWRVRVDYDCETSFNKEFYIDTINNPFTVYFDKQSTLPDGSDANKCMIAVNMSRASFKKQYPKAEAASFDDRGTGDGPSDWFTKDEIRVAEYFTVDRKRAKLVKLNNGQIFFAEDVPDLPNVLAAAGFQIVGERDSFKRTVNWCKVNAVEVLEEEELPFYWIPVIPCVWTDVLIDGKRMRKGLVRNAIDPQRMVNFWQSAITESLALGPKAKWLMADGQDEGHENEWRNANLSPTVTLHYKQTDASGQPAPPPQRMQPEPPPTGSIEAAFLATQNLSRVLGVFDPAVRGGAQHKSDKTLNAERSQSETSTFNGFYNLTCSIQHTGRIILSAIPKIYNAAQVKRIIGEDGRGDTVEINTPQQVQGEDGQAVEKVLNDVRVGEYDVVMDTGPGYDTKRQEGVETMLQLMGTPIGEAVAQAGADIMIRQMDFNGSETLADRMEAANPMAKIDEQSDIPPKVQMQLQQMQAVIKKQQEALQQAELMAKYRMDVEALKQEGATRRTLMQETTRAHMNDADNKSLQHSVESKAVTAQNVEEIKAIAMLMAKHIDTKDLEREIASRQAEQNLKHAEETMLSTGE